MKHLFGHQNQQMTRCSRYVLIIALLALLLPMTGWAHRCGPRKLTVENGNTVVYSIKGQDYLLGYEIVDKGDPLVAKIEPPGEIDQKDLVFKITGTGKGTTVFKLYWEGPQQQNFCRVKVTVTG
jgi:hypothetical protein